MSKLSHLPNHFLRAARESRGWSQEYVAELLGVSNRSILRWENGETKPAPHSISELCRIFGMKEDELGLPFLLPPRKERRNAGSHLQSVGSVRELEQFAEIQCYRAECAEHRIKVLEAELAQWRQWRGLHTPPTPYS